MAQFTKGTKAVIFAGENFVEISTDEVTLQAVCDAFGLSYDLGVFVKDKATGRPVATLPFEPVYMAAEGMGSSAQTVENANEDIDEEEDEEEVGKQQVQLLVLVHPSFSNGGPVDADKKEEGEEEGQVTEPGVNLGDGEAVSQLQDALASANTPAGAAIGAAMRQLVDLGAVELLSAESAQRIAQLPPYDPATAPGLLRRIIYPEPTYSPFRTRRDPLEFTGSAPSGAAAAAGAGGASSSSPHHQHHGKRGISSPTGGGSTTGVNRATFSSFLRNGAPYSSSLDTYGVELAASEDLFAAVSHHHSTMASGGGGSGEANHDEEAGTGGGGVTSAAADDDTPLQDVEQIAASLLKMRPELTPLTDEELNCFFIS